MADPKLVRPEFVNYNIMGLRPVKSTFNLDCEMVQKAIKEIADKEIDGINQVTVQHDRTTGAVAWFIWFNSNSDHFIDKSTNNTALGRSISRYSPKIQEFARKFGWCEADDDPIRGNAKVNIKHVFHGNSVREMHENLTALHISINPFLMIMFDVNGTAFKNEFNQNAPKVFLDRHYEFKKGSSGDFHTLVGLRIEKTLQNAVTDYQKPLAGKAGNFH